MIKYIITFLLCCLGFGAGSLHVNAQDSARYIVGDFHQHTTYTDGSWSISQLMKMCNFYGLDWWANSEHGGVSMYDASVSGKDKNTKVKWSAFDPNPSKGSGDKAEMWRWQTIREYSFPTIQLQRLLYPDKIIIQGLEWSVPGHEHASTGIISGQFVHDKNLQNADVMAEFEYKFDRGDNDTIGGKRNNWEKSHLSADKKMIEALNWLQTNYANSSWVVPGHPERKKLYSIADFRNMNNAAPAVCFGFEGIPGHQKREDRGEFKKDAFGEATFGGCGLMTAKVGGLWDALLSEGRGWYVYTNSDFHDIDGDFWPGEYLKNYTWVKDSKSPQSIVDGLHSGNNYIVMGDLISAFDFSITNGSGIKKTMGQTLDMQNKKITITIRVQDPEGSNHNTYSSYDHPKLDHIDIIAGVVTGLVDPSSKDYNVSTAPKTKVMARFGDVGGIKDSSGLVSSQWKILDLGWKEITWTMDNINNNMYFRVRGTNNPLNTAYEVDGNGNPLSDLLEYPNNAEKAFHDLWFYSNPIFIKTNSKDVQIEFIETTDVHGSIYPYDFTRNVPSPSSLAQVSGYVKHEREQNKNVVLLDNGDILQGQPIVYYSNYIRTDTQHICAAVMNYMGYDAATVGNHDIEASHPVYDKLFKEFDFPWLSANILHEKTGTPYFKPYVIINRNGIKIAVLGLTTPAIPKWLPTKLWEGMQFEDMVVSAKQWISLIKKNENPDLIIGLFHSGVEFTYGNQSENTLKNENASKLVAMKVPGFDLIFTGHDHKRTNDSIINTEGKTVYLLGGTNASRAIGISRFYLHFDHSSLTWKKIIKNEVKEVNDLPVDSAYVKKFQYFATEVKQYVGKQIGSFTTDISSRDALFGDAAFVDLIHRVQLDITGADISFAAPLSFDANIHKGNIYVRDMFELYKYENFLYTMQFSGKEIKDFLEYSYAQWFNTMKDSTDHLLLLKDSKLQNAFYNFESAAGINYVVDISKPAGERVSIVKMSDGKAFDLKKSYLVAVNSYRGSGGGGHFTDGAKISKSELNKRIVKSTENDLRYYLIQWIEKQKTIDPKPFDNWHIVPEGWAKRGKIKDEAILFPLKKQYP